LTKENITIDHDDPNAAVEDYKPMTRCSE